MNILADLRYVQADTDIAYVDSRVYCAEIIEVDHHDWMNNVLKKYLAIIKKPGCETPSL